MSRLMVSTDTPAGGDRIWLDVIGDVRSVRISTSTNGDLAASWQMYLNPKTNHRALAPGRKVIIPTGANKGWQGTLNNPRRGDVWDLNATGLAALTKNYNAIPTGTNALSLDDVVDAAIARGLPLTRPSALPTTEGTEQAQGKVNDTLNTVCDAEGKLWNVNRDGQITAADRPTNVAYILQANDTAGGRTITGFVTDVHVIYQDSITWATTTILRSATSRPYGRFEDVLDVTSRGPITLAKAQSIGDKWLAKRGPRLRFTSAFTIQPGQLLNPGGAPVDNQTVQAADGLVRVMLTDPDVAAGELAYQAVNAPVGETDYDSDSGVLNLTPLDTTPTGLAAVFA